MFILGGMSFGEVSQLVAMESDVAPMNEDSRPKKRGREEDSSALVKRRRKAKSGSDDAKKQLVPVVDQGTFQNVRVHWYRGQIDPKLLAGFKSVGGQPLRDLMREVNQQILQRQQEAANAGPYKPLLLQAPALAPVVEELDDEGFVADAPVSVSRLEKAKEIAKSVKQSLFAGFDKLKQKMPTLQIPTADRINKISITIAGLTWAATVASVPYVGVEATRVLMDNYSVCFIPGLAGLAYTVVYSASKGVAYLVDTFKQGEQGEDMAIEFEVPLISDDASDTSDTE